MPPADVITPTSARRLETSSLGDRILIVAPHPDDETLAAGGTMHALRARGADVRIVLLTAGDAYLRAARRIGRFSPDAPTYRRLGDMRFRESQDAAESLGIPASDVMCLGYPDGRLEAMWADPGTVTTGRNGSAVVPYDWALSPGAPCSGEAMHLDLTATIAGFAPETVIFPDACETHADHAYAHRFVMRALQQADTVRLRLTYLIHQGHYPFPWAYLPRRSLRPPRALRTDDRDWRSVTLGVDDVTAKESALRAFPSQNAIPDLRYFMRAFVRANEVFSVETDQ
ncbi:MAG: PIG-L family deacetylase [Coriobacteriia bacterium]|nr:PIG-L family deacetylase [Coriobacteriia bacterium]